VPDPETGLAFRPDQFVVPKGFEAVETSALLVFCTVLTVAGGTFLIRLCVDLTALIGIPQEPSAPHITTNAPNIFRFFIPASLNFPLTSSRKRFATTEIISQSDEPRPKPSPPHAGKKRPPGSPFPGGQKVV
jgi:hypothetical protein